MLYYGKYVEKLSAILKRYNAPVTFKVKCDALIGESCDEIITSVGTDDGFREISRTECLIVELHLIPVYATDIDMKLTDMDVTTDVDVVTLSAETPFLIALSYNADKGVDIETADDDDAVVIKSIMEYLNITANADGYISEKAFLEFNNVEVTAYEIDDELKVVDLTKTGRYATADASEIKVV